MVYWIITFVLGAIAVAFFVKVGGVFKEKDYLKNQDKKREAEEKKRFQSQAKEQEREIRHEERLKEIDGAARDPNQWERVLNTWPDEAEGEPAPTPANGSGGSARRDVH